MEWRPGIIMETGVTAHTVGRMIQAAARIYGGKYKYLTEANFKIICATYFLRNKVICQRDIEKMFRLSRSTVSSVIARMEKNGLIERENIEGDARLRRLKLTEEACNIAETLARQMAKLEKRVANGISDEDLQAYYRVCRALRKNTQEIISTERN